MVDDGTIKEQDNVDFCTLGMLIIGTNSTFLQNPRQDLSLQEQPSDLHPLQMKFTSRVSDRRFMAFLEEQGLSLSWEPAWLLASSMGRP
jgi:hypothetical protein